MSKNRVVEIADFVTRSKGGVIKGLWKISRRKKNF